MPADVSDNTLLWLLLGGLGLYVAYNYLNTPATAASGVTAPSTLTPSAAASETGTQAAGPAGTQGVPLTSAAALDQAAAAAGYTAPYRFTVGQWNYFHSQLTNNRDTGVYPQDNGQPIDSGSYVRVLNRHLTNVGMSGVPRSILDGTAFGRGRAMYGWD